VPPVSVSKAQRAAVAGANGLLTMGLPTAEIVTGYSHAASKVAAILDGACANIQQMRRTMYKLAAQPGTSIAWRTT